MTELTLHFFKRPPVLTGFFSLKTAALLISLNCEVASFNLGQFVPKPSHAFNTVMGSSFHRTRAILLMSRGAKIIIRNLQWTAIDKSCAGVIGAYPSVAKDTNLQQ